MRYDYCVIGGGIVGLAAAAALLARHKGASVVVVEKEAALGLHQTGRNSGVIHSGIYYTPGSLKARLCREGAMRTKAFCREHGIPFEERGKLIVATRPEELPRLEALAERAVQNGIEYEVVSAEGIGEREPSITGLKALFVPAASIVDYRRILAALAEEIAAAGGEVRLSTPVTGIREAGAEVEIETEGETIRAAQLVACAGLQSDRLARLAGMDVAHRIVPFRGEYYRLAPGFREPPHAMIYPVPDPALPFLGIHLTPMIDGRVSLGPNAMLGLAREGYGKADVSLRDLLDTLSFPGFWITVARNLRAGVDETVNSLSKRHYLKACQRYCPSIAYDDLRPMAAGIRAQAVLRDGTMVHDFLFLETDRMLHVCNAPSPAATSALPIGDMIVDRLSERRMSAGRPARPE